MKLINITSTGTYVCESEWKYKLRIRFYHLLSPSLKQKINRKDLMQKIKISLRTQI